MMHVGFETTPVLGAKRNLGDTWTMLKWQFSGKMGGHPEKSRRPYELQRAAQPGEAPR